MKHIIYFAAALIMVGCASNQKTTLSGLDKNDFDTIVNNQEISLFTLRNGDMEACVTNYGGRIVSLMVPDKDGRPRDVVLGHDNIRDYLEIDGNFGAIIGRYGNRINRGRFTLDSIDYQLPQNNYGHCLHGGPIGFHHSIWSATQTTDTTLVLALHSTDGDAGFPGNLNVEVVYSLTSDCGLKIAYTAYTDKPTIINLTNHSYFNLSGDHTKEITDELLTIKASGFTPIDSTFMPTGEIRSVKGTIFDFNHMHAIGENINADNEQIINGMGYDHNFVLDKSCPFAAQLYDTVSGIVMTVITDQPGLQFYSGNFLDGQVRGKDWPSVRLNPGEKYHTETVYSFSIH